MKKTTFALCFCNRSFMPGELVREARREVAKAVEKAGCAYIMMDEKATRFGGVETRDEGKIYAKWLAEHKGEYDGVVFSMPIFADENGAFEALRDAGVPILLQAYPDEIGKMDFARRRDAYCGKFSVTDVFTQCRIPFTVMEPPTEIVPRLSPTRFMTVIVLLKSDAFVASLYVRVPAAGTSSTVIVKDGSLSLSEAIMTRKWECSA